MLSIQTNVNSLVAQQNMSVNNAFQSKTIEQLTSGYRINSSGDDAAGLAVANKFRSIAELTQGSAEILALLNCGSNVFRKISSVIIKSACVAGGGAGSGFAGVSGEADGFSRVSSFPSS